MEGIITGSFVVFTCMLLGSIFCGRLFCAWLCPMGGMQECLFAVNAKNLKQGWKNYIKYAIWTIWIIAVILCFIFRKKEITVDFFYMTDHGISISNIYNYVIYYGIIFLVLIPAVLFGKRIFPLSPMLALVFWAMVPPLAGLYSAPTEFCRVCRG